MKHIRSKLSNIRKHILLFLSVFLLLIATGCAPSYGPSERWTQDIAQFRAFVLETHPKFTDETLRELERNIETRAAFNETLDALILDLPYLTDFEITVQLQHAAAVLEDNHFDILLSQLATEEEIAIYPLGFRWLSDGFYLLTTTEAFESALNHRLVSIGGQGIDDMFATFLALWSTENIYNARSAFARLLNNPVMLDAIGLRSGGQVTFGFERADGNMLEISLSPADLVSMDQLTAISFPVFPVDKRAEGDLPLFMDIRGSVGNGHNWFYFMEDYGVLYIRLELYMQNIDPQTGTFAPFAKDVKTAFEAHAPKAVIIDARYNPGGDNAYLAELFEFLAEHTESGMLFHFVDEGSWSASLLGAAHLKSLGAILLGQPMGQNTDFYGFHSVSVGGSELFFTGLDFPEDTDLDEYIEIGFATNEYPYFEIVTMTIRAFLELAEGGGSNDADRVSSDLNLNHSGLLVSVPNLFLSASQMFALDLEFYTLRPHILIEYTIQDWANNHDPVLAHVLALLAS